MTSSGDAGSSGAPYDQHAIEAALRAHPGVAAARVVREQAGADPARWSAQIVPKRSDQARELKFSLFYFADANAEASADKYRLYREGACFADQHGFEAVWTPERHFHPNGGLYPNPSVLSASLANITQNVRLRAGSVALPLHHPLRVAEEWSVVDNLSNGRVDLSFTSGWIPNDFSVWPEPGIYQRKREVMFRNIQLVQQLWQGGSISVRDGVGQEVDLEIFPKPIQPTLPIWLTCSGDAEMFERAGELGFNILTALLTMPLEEAAEKILLYRQARARAGHDPDAGHVTLMLHTYVGREEEAVRRVVQEPLTDYLQSHIGLMKTMAASLNLRLDQIDVNDPKWSRYLAAFAFERYYRLGSLIGTPEICLEMVDRLKAMTVDEVACLIDFGVDAKIVLDSLPDLHELKTLSDRATIDSRTLSLFLHEQLGADVGPVAVALVEALPTGPVAGWRQQPTQTAPPQGAVGDASGADNRADQQRAARERQRELMKRGRDHR